MVELVDQLRTGNVLHAPSWSWASRPDFFRFILSTVDNPRCRIRTHLRPEFSLLGSKLVTDGINPFGRLKEASNSLLLSARLISFPDVSTPGWRLTENAEWHCSNVDKGYLILVSYDWEPDRKVYQDGNSYDSPRGTTKQQLS